MTVAIHDDLQAMTTQSDWFLTVTIPAASNSEDAASRFEVEWKNARRQLSERWDEEELAQLDAQVAALDHGDAAAFVVVRAAGGTTLIEQLDEPVVATTVHEGPLPRWAVIIESRQRVISHVVVEADRAGADLTAFDGGSVVATESVEGSTLHIHRGHPGGWSQRRFQQRAENRWESNAREVAEEVAALARSVNARLVAVAGDVRAQTLIIESLPTDVAQLAIRVEAGSPEGIADEVVRALATMSAEEIRAAADRVRAGLDSGHASIDPRAIEDALRDGRVDTLVVYDDASDAGTNNESTVDHEPRLVDRAIAAALATDADIVVVPGLAMLEGPVAASFRW